MTRISIGTFVRAVVLVLAVSQVACGSAGDGSRAPPRAPPRVVEADSPVTVAAAGDIACDPESRFFNGGRGSKRNCHMRQTAEALDRIDPDLVLVLGDAQYEDGAYWKYLRSYDQTWGRWKDVTFATPGGEHDAFGGGGYYRYFRDRAGPRPDRTWYSLDVGSWHIVSVNANCMNVPGHKKHQCIPGSEQYEWFVNDLATTRQRCSILMVHEPFWSAGPEKINTRALRHLVEAFWTAGGEVILSGDHHNYQRFAPQDPWGNRDLERGVQQFIVGTGGKNMARTPFSRPQRNLEIFNPRTFGVLELTLEERQYRWRFVPERGTSFSDSGARRCHA